MEDDQQNPIERIGSHLTALRWPDLVIEANRIFINRPEQLTIVEKNTDGYHISFVWYNSRENKYGIRSVLQKVVLAESVELSDVFYLDSRGYKLSYDSYVKGILQLGYGGTNSNKVDKIEINPNILRQSQGNRILKIPLVKWIDIVKDAKDISDTSSSYGSSVARYLTNKFSKKHINKDTKSVTTTQKGEFDFLVHRFNLKTKKKKRDYEKHLSKNDISSLQDLVLSFIQKEIFEPDFLRELDEYFIREKLKGIIALGRDILNLKSTDLETTQAKIIISKIGDGKKVKQLETLWQKFFEKYLLYLIFSYKEIYPKVQLEDIDTDKKYPDFVGINHYNGVDVIEIKTHLTPALIFDKSHKNFSFSSDMSKAIIQIMNYLDAIKQQKFKDPKQGEKITETTYEENLYRPRGIIIISSWERISKNNKKAIEIIKRDFTKLRNSLHDIEILTFDEILDIADNYCNRITKNNN